MPFKAYMYNFHYICCILHIIYLLLIMHIKKENEIISFLRLFCHVVNCLKLWTNFEKRTNKYLHAFLDLSIIFLSQSVSGTKHSVTWTLSAMHLADSVTLFIMFWVVIMRRICNFKCLYFAALFTRSFPFFKNLYSSKICFQSLKRIQKAHFNSKEKYEICTHEKNKTKKTLSTAFEHA